MVDQQKINENELRDEVYIEKPPVVRLVFFAILVVSTAFFFNFPIKENVQGALVKALNKNKKCPVSYSKMDLELLMPTLNFKDLNIQGRCFGKRRGPGISFDSAMVKIQRPTVVPPGLLFKVNAKDSITNLDIFATTGITSASIKIKDSIVNSSLISEIGNLPVKLNGSLSVDALVDTDYKVPQSGSFHISSKDLSLPPQTIRFFAIKRIGLSPLLLKGTLEGSSVKIQKFQVGNLQTKIEIIVNNAVLKLNKKDPNRHTLDMVGRIRLSPEFLKEFPILAPFLASANIDKEGFYKIQLKGPINSLRPKFL